MRSTPCARSHDTTAAAFGARIVGEHEDARRSARRPRRMRRPRRGRGLRRRVRGRERRCRRACRRRRCVPAIDAVTPFVATSLASSAARSARPRSAAARRMPSASTCDEYCSAEAASSSRRSAVKSAGRADVDEVGPALGEGAGLVERGRAHAGELLDDGAALDDDAGLRGARESAEERDGRRDQQRARGRQHEHLGEPRRVARDRPRGAGEDERDGGERDGEPVGEPHDGRARVLRRRARARRSAGTGCRRCGARRGSARRAFR